MDSLLRIKQLLNERNWSVYRLAKMSGVSQSTLSNMFTRNNDPTINTLEDICKGFGITLSQFFSDDNEEMVLLTKEQKELLEKWATLTEEQKSALLKLLK